MRKVAGPTLQCQGIERNVSERQRQHVPPGSLARGRGERFGVAGEGGSGVLDVEEWEDGALRAVSPSPVAMDGGWEAGWARKG